MHRQTNVLKSAPDKKVAASGGGGGGPTMPTKLFKREQWRHQLMARLFFLFLLLFNHSCVLPSTRNGWFHQCARSNLLQRRKASSTEPDGKKV